MREFNAPRTERNLERDGYVVHFGCSYNMGCPPDLDCPPNATGWQMRRLITDWCKRHKIDDFRIFANKSFLKDLHGSVVYQLWIRHEQKATP